MSASWYPEQVREALERCRWQFQAACSLYGASAARDPNWRKLMLNAASAIALSPFVA